MLDRIREILISDLVKLARAKSGAYRPGVNLPPEDRDARLYLLDVPNPFKKV